MIEIGCDSVIGVVFWSTISRVENNRNRSMTMMKSDVYCAKECENANDCSSWNGMKNFCGMMNAIENMFAIDFAKMNANCMISILFAISILSWSLTSMISIFASMTKTTSFLTTTMSYSRESRSGE